MSEALERFETALRSLEADRAVDIALVKAVIDAAAEAGSPKAALMRGCAAGVGYGCVIDVGEAVRWVRIAAERGDESAAQQLMFLDAAESLDIESWIAPKPARAINEAPLIQVSDGFLNAGLCAWLMRRAQPLLEPSYVYDPKTGLPARDDARTNSAASFKLVDLDLPLILIRHRIANTIGAPVEHFERSSVFRYEPGQTFADHADFISTDFSAEIRERGQRPLTFLVYLNDEFEGGETHFTAIDKKIRVRPGDALFWSNVDEQGRPDERTYHAGAPPTRGEKWLFSQFIRDKPQLPG